MGDLTRKQRERRRHRRAVLEAAEEVFAGKGFHGATVQEIAERAEFGVGTIYTMFESKMAIYRSLLRMRAGQYIQSVREMIAEESDPRRKISTIIRAKLEFFDRNRQFFRIFSRVVVSEHQNPPCSLVGEAREIYGGYLQMVREIFEEGIAQGRFSRGDGLLMALSMEGMTNSIIDHWINGPEGRVSGRTSEAIERILFEGILTERGRQ